ncbi:MAG: hypothetical protein M5U33_05580 [Pseudorhodoplanes sp.]|nr:hypothetical protein [Pseudorhodoplanes sp.]
MLPLAGAPAFGETPRAVTEMTIVLAGDAGFGADPRGSAKANIFLRLSGAGRAD